MKFRAIIQARLASTRLPAKVLRQINGRNLIERIAERLGQVNYLDFSYVFAIAREKEDKLEQFLRSKELNYIYGDEFNVLNRFISASADLEEDDYIFRLTSDNPFIDFTLLMAAMQWVINANIKPDYLYYGGLPLGMGFELVRVKALRKQLNFDLGPNHCEHVTPFIRENPAIFQIEKLKYPLSSYDNYREIPIRLTCDTEEDLALLEKTARHFEKNKKYFLVHDIFKLYSENSQFFQDNLHIEQKTDKSFQTFKSE